MGAAAAVAGQNLGAGQAGSRRRGGARRGALSALAGAAVIGSLFFFVPRQLLAVFGMSEPAVVEIGVQLLRVLSVSGLFIAVALTYTGGLQGTGDTKSPLYISIVSQILIPLGICFVDPADRHARADGHLDRDPHRARDALRAERAAVQSGQVARDRGEDRLRVCAANNIAVLQRMLRMPRIPPNFSHPEHPRHPEHPLTYSNVTAS